jgi:hypothetical protein
MRRLTAAFTFSVIAACSFGISVVAQDSRTNSLAASLHASTLLTSRVVPVTRIRVPDFRRWIGQRQTLAQSQTGGTSTATEGSSQLTAFADANASADLDQFANLSGNPADWVNGNLGASKSIYFEGDSIPYRMKFDDLTLDSHTVTIEWDTTKSGKHAIDYLTTFNRSAPTANPCAGVTGCSTFEDFDIRPDGQVTSAGVTPIAGKFRLYGGRITAVSAYSYPDGAGFAGDKSSQIAITFTATAPNPVLAWGGHVAARADWGANNSAVAIPGSPYHTRLIDLDRKGGNQDRSLSEDAVIFPGSITVIKDANPDGSQSFAFTASPSPLTNFSLVDNGTSANTKLFSNITNFQLYSVSESTVTGWTLTSKACSSTTPNGGSYTPTSTGVTINMKEGENYTCTFSNTRQKAHLIVIKDVKNDNGGTAVASGFTLSVLGGAPSPSSFPGAESPGTNVTLEAKTNYTVSESVRTGYIASYSADCDNQSGGIPPGETRTCIVTNDDETAHLKLVKTVTNNNGGTAVATDFTLSAAGPTPISGAGGADRDVDAGTYTLSETNVAGYTAGSWSCSGGSFTAPNKLALALGQSATCTINNDDRSAHLKLVKTVTNNNGGTAVATDFTLSAGGPTPIAGTGGTERDVNAGTYTLSETKVAGYTAGNWSCSGGSFTAPDKIALALGQSATCTINNDDQTAHLKLVKTVTNNNGGTAVATAFTLSAAGPTPISGAGGVERDVNAGTYNLSETTLPGYTAGNWSCVGGSQNGASVTLALGQTATCTINNDDKAPKLKVIKRVINSYGGTATAGSFTMSVAGNSPSPASFPGSETGTVVTLNAGSFSVSESIVNGYTQASAVGCSGTLAVGDYRTCTITNRDIPAQLVVNKVCDPVGDTGTFNLQIDSITRKSDASCGEATPVVYVNAGTHSVGETAGAGTTLSDYVTAIGGACTSGGGITLGLGQSATCTITNTRKASVRVVKTVWNPATGQSTPPAGSQAFTFQLRQGSSSSVPGTILETQILNAANLGVVTFATKLTPGATYALCETVTPGWMTALITPFYTVHDSSGDSVCHDFTPSIGQVLSFSVNNVPVSAHPTRTIGFWKNWSSCSGAGQAPKLDRTLAASERAGISIGNLVLHGSTSSPNVAPDCAKAVNILDKTTIDGRKQMASDPAFNLAAQLLGAKLNVQAGAGVCPAAVTAINNGQSLLAAVAFNGLTHGTMSTTQVNRARSLATALDNYNNDNTLLCAVP